MCRIAGIISKNTEPVKLHRQVKSMCDVMQHGGPDDEGIYTDEETGFCFGHRRLSILDLSSAGHQPMLADEKRLILTFNGEIYNFRELRAELETKNYDFITNTDTEVILKAYQEWGISSFSKLSGMFAFALHDKPANKTFLVRDASGIKPLYYSINKDVLVFSSEVKAFSKTGHHFQTDENWKVHFLAFGHIPEPFTSLKNVSSLPKGQYLVWDHHACTGKLALFKKFTFSNEITDSATAIERIKTNLILAVKQHLIADAPIGVFLSGGIDSSILTLIAQRFKQEQLNTLSINFEETEFSEKKYQQLITKNLKGNHFDFLITCRDFEQHFETIIRSIDQPTTDGINSWFISKCAKESGMKSVLSGIGADELFGGYPSFTRMKTLARLTKLPKAFLRSALNHPNPKYKRLYYLSYHNPIGEYLFLRGFFTPDVISEVLDTERKKVDEVLSSIPISNQVTSLEGGNRASWLETNLYMQNQLLKDTDCMSMSHGLEVRVPFLDKSLIETISQINAGVKFNPAQPKSLLINAFNDVLPAEIVNRKKMGFTFPFQDWMKNFEQLSNPDLYTNKKSKKLMQQFGLGKLYWSKAFALYQVNNAR